MPNAHEGRSAIRIPRAAVASSPSACASASCSTTNASMALSSATRWGARAPSFSVVTRTRFLRERTPSRAKPRRSYSRASSVAGLFDARRHRRRRLRQRQRAAVDAPTSTFRGQGAKVPADGVLGHLELKGERRGDDGPALRQTAEDDIAPGKRGFELHNQAKSCTNKTQCL
jgi:hypothetical protein